MAYATHRGQPVVNEVPSLDDVVDAAVRSGDEHAIMLTEAAVRASDRALDRVLLAAAWDAARRLG